MIKNISLFLLILNVCFTEVYCNIWDPRVWPETFVDDGNPFIEFTCGAYLKSEEWLSWYIGGTYKKICTTIQQQKQHEGYRTLKLLWPLSSLKNDKVYCSKENQSYWSGAYYWRKTNSEPIPIEFLRKIESTYIENKSGPLVTPAEFVDDGKQVIEFTCYAYLTKEKTLSWYQIKDKSVSKLGMIQQEADYGITKITLQKTLEPSDNGSQIYCEKEGMDVEEEDKILITFDRHIEALEPPYVTVEPSADVAFFDEGDKLEFVCSGSKAVDGRAFTWYLQTPGFNQVVPPIQYFSKSTNQNSLTLPMGVFDHGTLIYCAQDFTLRSVGAVSSITSYGELARSRTITLLHRGQCNKKDKPRVLPDKFEDDHKPFIQFTCYAFLESGQLLSWYQSKGLNESAALLRLVQLQDPRAEEGDWVVLTLNKTLEPADNGSEIYCARQSVLPDGNFSDVLSVSERIPLTFHRDVPPLGSQCVLPDGNFSAISEIQRVALTFQRDIPPLKHPFIDMEPNTTSVYLESNTTVRLTCSGSKPVDGRNYTWFRKDPESGLTVPKDQKYDTSTNTNVLDLSLNESSQMKMSLFCVQGFYSYIRNGDSLRVQMYGELVVSDIVTVIQRDKQGETQNSLSRSSMGTTHLLLAVTIPLSLLVLVVAAAAWWMRKRRAAAPVPPTTPVTPAQSATPSAPIPAPRPLAGRDKEGYGDYANVCREMDQVSPPVLYAELDLSKNAPQAARAQTPESPYAEIAVSKQWH